MPPIIINDPVSKNLITETEKIKEVTLEHCVKILQKNAIKECDREELRAKEKRHKDVMEGVIAKGEELDKGLYYKVVKRIKLKNKKMYHLRCKAGKLYISAMFVWMKRIIKYELVPEVYSITWLFSIWKRKGSPLDLNMSRFVHNQDED